MVSDNMAAHCQYETKDIKPEHGIAAFVKNLITEFAGGEMKARKPINFQEATGALAHERLSHPEWSQKHNYQQLFNQAAMEIGKLKESGQAIMPSQVSAVLSPILNQVALQAPKYAQVFQDTLKGLIPEDPLQEAIDRGPLGMIGGQTQTPPGAGVAAYTTQAPPRSDEFGRAVTGSGDIVGA